nr:probable carboxylesterase 15 [Coffea arabica]
MDSSSSSTAQQAIEDCCFGVLKLCSDGSISRTSHKEHQVKTHDDGLLSCPYYRLAPEDRLPAALEDAVTALKFLQAQALRESREVAHEKWLFDIGGVDVDRVFIFGDSSGENIAHHLAIQLGSGSLELSPIRVRGCILLSPFFGGIIRTKSEEESPKEDFWSQEIYDQ